MTYATDTKTALVTDQELLDTFRPVFERIRVDAIERESERTLPYEQIGWLREAGFGRLRVPVEHGGFGASVEQVVLLLIELGAADSNIPQALRGQIGFSELVLSHPDPEYRNFWLRELGSGAIIGNAESERTGTFSTQTTAVRAENGKLLLTGTKYYTTGSIFADWINVSALVPDALTGELVPGSVQVRADAPGVKIHDDWDGFGQRLTGSGTTEFTDVEVDARLIRQREADDVGATIQNAVYQLVHLANLAGISTAGLAEITTFVRSRTRNLFNPAIPAHKDPVALQVIGETFGTVETVRASVLAAAATVDETSRRQLAGTATDEDFARADAHVYGIQATVIDLTLRLVSRMFEVGGASATAQSRRLDRLWRNARTISSHNPAIYRQQHVGDYVVNGVAPSAGFLTLFSDKATDSTEPTEG